MGGRGALLPAATLWLGLAAGRAWAGEHPGFGLLALAVAVLAAAPAAWGHARRGGGIALAVATLAFGAARGAHHVERLAVARSGVRAEAVYRLEGEVVEPPSVRAGRVRATLAVERSEPPLPRGSRLRLRLSDGPEVAWGDRLACLAELEPPGAARNPGGGDPRLAADAAGLAASGRAFTHRVTGRTWPGALLAGTAVRWRRSVERTLGQGLSPEAAALARPLVTGDRGELPAELDADFRAAGLVHLLALSGLHVSALAAAARAVVASAGGSVGPRALAGLLAALFYVLLAGPLPSLARAAATEAWVAAARIARRPVDSVQALAVGAIVLLALEPGWAFDLGFQLSCAACVGLAAAAAWATSWPRGARRWAGPAVATLAAQALCAPLLMARLHGIAWPALLANLAAVPCSGLLLASAWLAVAAERIAGGAGHLFFSACEGLARAMGALTHAAAGWPGALIATGHEPGVTMLAAAGALLLASEVVRPRARADQAPRGAPSIPVARAAGLFASLLAIVLAATARELRPPPGTTWIVALDVGQGDATAIGEAGGWWLVDAGPRQPGYDAGERVVNPFLRWAAIRRLEALVLTHGDGDHIGGADAVRRRVEVRDELEPAGTTTPGRARRVSAGERPVAGAPVVVRWPPRRPTRESLRGDNAGAVVLEIARGPTRALLPADVDSVVEGAIDVEAPLALLKAGHHGSASSSGAAWLARMRPRVAWISAGARNPYGHPSPAVLARLGAVGARIDRTDREGALWYELRADGVRRIDWRAPPAGGDSARDPRTSRALRVPIPAE